MFNTYFFHTVRTEIIINKKMKNRVLDFHKRKKKGTPATMLSFEKGLFAYRVFRKAQKE